MDPADSSAIFELEAHRINEEISYSLVTEVNMDLFGPRAISSLRFQLDQRDHWFNNDVLQYISAWARNERDRLFWIGGTSGLHKTWVTELSVDMCTALNTQETKYAAVFCDNRESHLSCDGLISHLIAQMLFLFPKIACTRPQDFSSRRVARLAKSLQGLLFLLEKLLEEIDDFFVIIDRIEECQVEESGQLVGVLIPWLAAIARTHPGVSIILTSICEVPDELETDDVYAIYNATHARGIGT